MDVLDAIKTRRAIRKYKPNPIPDDVLQRLKDALRFAPSACNFQPWKFILVTDPQLKMELVAACCDQKFIADAPLIVVGCGFRKKTYHKMGGCGDSIDLDIGIALDHLTLAAADEGIGTCWIGAFDEEAVKKVLGVPKNVKVVALIVVGYPESEELLCPCDESRRKTGQEIFCDEKFQT
jgi:nitroreductase